VRSAIGYPWTAEVLAPHKAAHLAAPHPARHLGVKTLALKRSLLGRFDPT
jgi:hypothetical protein